MNAALTAHETTFEQRSALIAALDAFTEAYLECALWSSTECDEDGNMGAPLDENHDFDSLSLETLESAIADCKAFQEENADDLAAVSDEYGADNAQHGHDFWLTRNGHGCGFWDRGYGELGEALSKASKAYGSVDLMAHEGVVYGS